MSVKAKETRRRVWWHPTLAAITVLALLVQLSRLDTGLPVGPGAVILGLLTFLMQVNPVHVTTSKGHHSVSLTDAVLAGGLLTVAPHVLVVAMALGMAPALLRTRPPLVRFAVNLSHTLLLWSLAATGFHLLTDVGAGITVPATLLALTAGVLSFLSSAVTIHLPIGLATGSWRFAEGEVRGVADTMPVAAAATAAAVIAAVLSSISLVYVVLLALPVAHVAGSLRDRARAEDMRRVLDVAVTESDHLRRAADVPTALRRAVDEMQRAYDASGAVLIVDRAGGVLDHAAGTLAGEVAEGSRFRAMLRAYARAHAGGDPRTDRDHAVDAIVAATGEPELLAVPVGSDQAPGIVVLSGRRLGPFRSDHVELSRTLGAAMSAALERDSLSHELDAAGKRQAELEQRASHDPLTGLGNRRLLEQELLPAVLHPDETAVVYIDLTEFKQTNDTHGHKVGDQVLVATAERIRSCVRPDDVVARLGGDEFAVLLRGEVSDRARDVGERILAALAAPLAADVPLTGIRAAVGVAVARAGDDPDSLLVRADRAMYAAKAQGSHEVRIAGVEAA